MRKFFCPLLICLTLFSACSSPNRATLTLPAVQISPSPSTALLSTPQSTYTPTAPQPTDTAAPPSPTPTGTITPSPTLPPPGVFAIKFYPPLVLDYLTEQWVDQSDYDNTGLMVNYLQNLELKSCKMGPLGASGFYPENMKEITLGRIVYHVFLDQKTPDGNSNSYYFAMRTPAENFETATGGVPHFSVTSSAEEAKKCRTAAEEVLATLRRADQPTQTPTAVPTRSSVGNINFAAGISADGRFLAFTSYDDHLVPGDTNGMPDAFVYDRETGAIERVSVTSDGKQLPGWTFASSISADGRYVLFSSDNRSLQLFGSHLTGGLFLHDRQTGQTELLNLDPGNEMSDYNVSNGKISADGRFVVVEVYGMAPVIDRNDQWNVYLLDRQTKQTKRLSQAPDGSPADGSSNTTAMTPDGRWIAFLSQASNLAPGDQPCTDPIWRCADLFVYDRVNAKLERIPVGFGMCMGCPGDRLSISADGRWIAYNDMDDQSQVKVKVYDRESGKVETVCADDQGICTGYGPSLSADGRWLAFDNHQVFLKDRQTGQIRQMSVSGSGQAADGPSGIITLQGEGFSNDAFLSADGQWLAFSSQAANLLPKGVKKQSCTLFLDNPFPCYDLFLHNRESGETIWVHAKQP